MIPHQPLADDLAHGQIESVLIVEAHAVIIAEGLLIQIPEKVERLNRNVCALQATLQEAPKVLQTIRVDFTPCMLYSVATTSC